MLAPVFVSGTGSMLGRWAGFGPYYAMFPYDFAQAAIMSYTERGEAVLDPFAGRGTAVYAAAALGRTGRGIEIHPAGWVYGATKLAPSSKGRVLSRLEQLCGEAKVRRPEEKSEFFKMCFAPSVLTFLETARAQLDWRNSPIDRTLMGFILVYLHGKLACALSNQMRQTKAMAPDYSVKWWMANGMDIAPRIDALEFLSRRIEWRYAEGAPEFRDSSILLGDSTKSLSRLRVEKKFRLLLTSPPYFSVTNYHYDQWLRLWLLGSASRPTKNSDGFRGRFEGRATYRALLTRVFSGSKPLLMRGAVVYVRTDARKFTSETTLEVLKAIFPRKRISIEQRPFARATQTALFGDREQKPGEVDIIVS